MASRNACCTDGVAPSPTWQQGAITMKLSFGLVTPSLAADKLATPPPAAFTVTLAPEGEIAITRLLVVTQDTGRSVSACPADDVGVAVRVRVCPRLSVTVLLLDVSPPSTTLFTG